MTTILPSLKTVVMILMMNVKVVDKKDDVDTNLDGKVHLDDKLNPDDNTDADNQIFDPDNTDPEDSYGDPDLINNNPSSTSWNPLLDLPPVPLVK